MHFFKKILLFALGIVIFSNCTDASIEDTAKKICECVEPVIKINQEMEVLKSEAKIEQLTDMMGKAGEIQAEAIKCAQENTSEKINKDALKKALNKSCEMKETMLEKFIGEL